ncbi:unnamed protein product [Chondrus crispus]|uniref:Tc1-like transposase DDE domain-containing protein n=1 Tax=Chondrus crispus TaxID=2769 RepID=R7QFC0_CHOCR|nr:unnamed protein product [Chondrus crispus]CDF36453.1 unnamed protein product [Chondrus crispus]|eukprot:XP_005716272.1 unnamed protein product [Chondrus crispus]
MTPLHKEKRVKWCRKFISKGESFWNAVVFSDEKKFNGDGPDGFASYWHDLRTTERIFSKRQNGGFSVMVWGAVSLYGVSSMMFIDGKQDSKKYVDILRHGLLPFAAEVFGEEQRWFFQQDNAPIHTSGFTRSWLSEHSISTLPWPAKSPDVNIIGNVWGVMARMVYARGKLYQNVEDLKVAIEEAWSTVGSGLLLTLYKSLPCRMHATNSCYDPATHIHSLTFPHQNGCRHPSGPHLLAHDAKANRRAASRHPQPHRRVAPPRGPQGKPWPAGNPFQPHRRLARVRGHVHAAAPPQGLRHRRRRDQRPRPRPRPQDPHPHRGRPGPVTSRPAHAASKERLVSCRQRLPPHPDRRIALDV